MGTFLSDRYAEAIAEAERKLEKQQIELERLKRLYKRSRQLKVLWPEKVSSKNAYKTIQSVQILMAFKAGLEGSRSHSDLSEIRLSTKQLWRLTQLPSVYNSNDVTQKFRGYLSKMKRDKLIVFNSTLRRWQLTEKAIARIE